MTHKQTRYLWVFHSQFNKDEKQTRMKLAGHFWWDKLCMYSGQSFKKHLQENRVQQVFFFIFSFYLITIFFRALVELSNSRKQFSFATINPCHSPSWIRRTRIVILSNYHFPSVFNAVLECPVVFFCFFFDKGKLVVCPDKA